MKKNLISIAMLAFSVCMLAAPVTDGDIFFVPTAKSIRNGKGTATITRKAPVNVNDNSLNHAAKYLKNSLSIIGVSDEEQSASIKLNIVKNAKLGNEGYLLDVTENDITISGQTPLAVLWGIQTLLQMQDVQDVNGKFTIRACKITDYPDYRMRGFMIDVARKFIPMDYLKNLVRTMSYYKMNMLQIHLNDNGFKQYFHNNWEET